MINNKKVGIYIHIPYCKSKCSYCSFISGTDFSTQKSYVKRLSEEINSRVSLEQVASPLSDIFKCEEFSKKGYQEATKKPICDSIFIGGGTPSVLYYGGLKEIVNAVEQNFEFDSNLEFTIEANPESCSSEFLVAAREVGINRLSLGLQSCNNNILKSAGRLHSFEQFLNAYRLARKYGFTNISADIIMGLAGETEHSFKESLAYLTDLDLTHISVYALKCEEGTKLFESGYEPSDDFIADLYQLAVQTLEKSGFNRYEVSNFAKVGFDCKHNKKYWTLAPYYGFGVAASSFDGTTRRMNTTDINQYLSGKFFGSEINVSDQQRDEFLMLGLRLSRGISLKEYKDIFNESLLETYQKNIETLIKNGYLILENDYLKIHPKHMFIMNSIYCALTE